MTPIQSILVVLDRSARDTAVCEKASHLARLLNAELELFLCDAEHALALKQSFDQREAEEGRTACLFSAKQYLESARARLSLDTARTRSSAWCDSPLSEGICRKVAQSRPDLVMKSPDCDFPGCELSFSDNDWQLASTCPAPIMFIRRRSWSANVRIGAAVDASSLHGVPLVREIVALASQIHSHTRGQFEVLSCVPKGESYSRHLDDALAHMPMSRAAVHVLQGDADAELPRFCAERNYDLLVLGALAHRSGVAPRVGSLTSKLIEALDCDLVLVKVR